METAALRRSDELKTALLRAVSHDLRTPLTAIVTAGHALGSGSLTSEEREQMSAASVEKGERLSALIDKLFDLSRLQAGRLEPRRESSRSRRFCWPPRTRWDPEVGPYNSWSTRTRRRSSPTRHSSSACLRT